MPYDGAGDTLKESRPAATRIEFRGRFIQRSIAACAGVDSRDGMLIVFTSAWTLGSLFAENSELLWRPKKIVSR